MTGSMQRALAETDRRRARQEAFNVEHGLTPVSITRPVKDVLEGARETPETTGKRGRGKDDAARTLPASATAEQVAREIRRLEGAMLAHARNLEFEEAAARRDEISALRQRVLEIG
jgi:excinuclease ABC subunit B